MYWQRVEAIGRVIQYLKSVTENLPRGLKENHERNISECSLSPRGHSKSRLLLSFQKRCQNRVSEKVYEINSKKEDSNLVFH
jgi:hypothetical protein